MSHTKEPWALRESLSPKWVELKIEDYNRASNCINACAGLTDPEKQIKDLVLIAERILNKHFNIGVSECETCKFKLESALEPFNNIQPQTIEGEVK